MTTKSTEGSSSRSRSEVMRAVRSKDTTPEIIVRRLAHRMGFRYSLHCKDLPGNPDLVFVSRRKIIFVNGCFWHGHDCARGARQPKDNAEYWRAKISRNVKRDSENLRALQEAGWQVMTVWECETPKRKRDALENKIKSFLT
ncbi:very short patch repair endonuclease [Mesorhizobium sp. BH1-1-5]|uniref:very short patch repair endonuclease n=1 Tax=Mesorhizobium sp. BH1-1-5 TaxID=2876661 RepID=UPI001CCDBB9C|nr:very short patch repair endonuclease [Mesorhizobium sp. BH1-1-5]MBZ9986701.1 very short patch repair endonuclease [Mesorhizobium sp. BH1-1-5]